MKKNGHFSSSLFQNLFDENRPFNCAWILNLKPAIAANTIFFILFLQVVPDVVRGDDMDIRQYVWITKVPGGLKTDSHLVSGVVFRKNVSHKRMASFYKEPKILMMSCAIEYQVIPL